MLLVVVEQRRKERKDEGEGQKVKEKTDEDHKGRSRIRLIRIYGTSILDNFFFFLFTARFNFTATSQMNCHFINLLHKTVRSLFYTLEKWKPKPMSLMVLERKFKVFSVYLNWTNCWLSLNWMSDVLNSEVKYFK